MPNSVDNAIFGWALKIVPCLVTALAGAIGGVTWAYESNGAASPNKIPTISRIDLNTQSISELKLTLGGMATDMMWVRQNLNTILRELEIKPVN